MKQKLGYYLPAIFFTIIYSITTISLGLDSVNVLAWLVVILLYMAGYLLNKNKTYGAVFGIIVGIIFIYLGFQDTGQIIKETTLGIILIVYYILCSFTVKKNKIN